MKVADEVWTSVALLHKEHPERADFSIEEIKARANKGRGVRHIIWAAAKPAAPRKKR